jgi:thymidylate kinase
MSLHATGTLKMPPLSSVVIDGHDGSGKTSIAKGLAKELGGEYVKPFDSSLGKHIAWLWKTRQFELADSVARSAIAHEMLARSKAKILIFDRHWLTMFTVLPEKYYQLWAPLPSTILCWTDPSTTGARLRQRGEKVDRQNDLLYCRRYRGLALRYEVPILNTTGLTVEVAIGQALLLLSHSSLCTAALPQAKSPTGIT